ncbi:MAG: hypothetical protein QOJ84_931, partial [Bradyrhizobium sp.]|nr:hypothetical protein [Bradyrhizobium sp.]
LVEIAGKEEESALLFSISKRAAS